MGVNKQNYKKFAEKKTKNTTIAKNYFFAFIVGGIICVIGQGIWEIYQYYGLSSEDSVLATSISLVFIGACLTGIGIYDKIAKFAGAGTIVPITGFANSIVSPAMEFKSEGLVLGIGAKMFVIAGPVIVYGTVFSVAYGIIIYIFGLF